MLARLLRTLQSKVVLLMMLAIVFDKRCLVGADMFTSVVDMQKALHAEHEVSHQLRNYIASERERLDALERYANDFETHSLKALDDAEKHVSNPVNAFLLMKRFTHDWEKIVNKYIRTDAAEEFLKSLGTSTCRFPDKAVDYHGSAMALLRLQDTYDLQTSDVAGGALRLQGNMIPSPIMTADDCFQLGVSAYNYVDFYHAVLWIQQAMKIGETETHKTTDKKQLLDYLAFATFKQGNLHHAYNLTQQWLQLEPDNDRAKANLHYYTQMIRQEELDLEQKNETISTAFKNVRILDEWRSAEDFSDYEKLCRGIKTKVIKDEHLLTCQYRRHTPLFYINPLREEVMSFKPRIVVYHNILTDPEMEMIKKLAIPKLRRSEVFNLKEDDSHYSTYRTSQSAWIQDSEDQLIARVTQKASALANLTTETVELLQVLNYGIGGHYEPHYDFARDTELTTFTPWQGNRIATAIFYLSDVEAGGATVFNLLGVRVPTEKGACLLWYNLLENGDGDYSTRHAGCPVLSGNKWVANKWFHIRGQEFARPCSLSPGE